jgi:hypothetical protein
LTTKMTKSVIEDREDGSGLEVVEIRTSTILLLVAQVTGNEDLAEDVGVDGRHHRMMAPVGVTVVGAVQTALSAVRPVPLSAEPEDGLTDSDSGRCRGRSRSQ